MENLKPCPFCGGDEMSKTVNADEQARIMERDEMIALAAAHGCGEEISAGVSSRCLYCGSINGTRFLKKENCYECADCGVRWIKTPLNDIKKNSDSKTDYPQDVEENEYRYIAPAWLDAVARGLTAGALKHPGETWRTIPSEEHLARAMRHINLYRAGDRSEPHIINASMRLMMAFATREA